MTTYDIKNPIHSCGNTSAQTVRKLYITLLRTNSNTVYLGKTKNSLKYLNYIFYILILPML